LKTSQAKKYFMMTSTTQTDQQLIEAFMNGNTSAFEQLLNRHKNRIFTSIVMMVKDRSLADDIFQDVFIKVIDTIKAGQYNEEGKFLPWVLRIAHNQCIDHFRRVKKNPSFSVNDHGDMLEASLFTNENAETAIIKVQRASDIQFLLNKLPEDQREVIVMRHFANLSFKEIAQKTNCSINTALGRMRYALINLRKLMAEVPAAVA
jgi:RNA polymerase sigma-70 factor (ECF subfamily)